MSRIRQSSPGRLETEKFINEDDILVEQLRRIYLAQQRDSDKLDKKNKFLKKWGYIFSCCI